MNLTNDASEFITAANRKSDFLGNQELPAVSIEFEFVRNEKNSYSFRMRFKPQKSYQKGTTG